MCRVLPLSVTLDSIRERTNIKYLYTTSNDYTILSSHINLAIRAIYLAYASCVIIPSDALMIVDSSDGTMIERIFPEPPLL